MVLLIILFVSCMDSLDWPIVIWVQGKRRERGTSQAIPNTTWILQAKPAPVLRCVLLCGSVAFFVFWSHEMSQPHSGYIHGADRAIVVVDSTMDRSWFRWMWLSINSPCIFQFHLLNRRIIIESWLWSIDHVIWTCIRVLPSPKKKLS
jgi:hypothetical protein